MLYHDALQRTQDEYDAAVRTGRFTSAPSLVSSLNVLLLFAWLLVARDLSGSTYRRCRWPAFIAIAAASIWSLLFCRSPGVIGSIGVGLNAALLMMLSTNFVLLHDSRQLKRLTLRDAVDDDDLSKLTWQSMPERLSTRVFWILDLVTSLRGQYWSWAYPATHGDPQSLTRAPCTRSDLLKYTTRFLLDYMALDLIKCTMIADPYFYTGLHTDPPPAHVRHYLTSALTIYLYRILLCAVGFVIAIDLEFTTVRLMCVNLLGPRILGLYGSSQSFPPFWGTPRSILRKGLRGFWAETWHQLFRLHFSQIGDAVAALMLGPERTEEIETNKRKRKPASRGAVYRSAIRMTVGFLLSGCMHACGSYTMLGPTRPWAPFLFFALQPVGIALQIVLTRLLLPQASVSGANGPPRALQVFNAVFAMVWLGGTVQLLMDDVSSGGMWLFEAVPISLIRGLGFSAQDNRLWCW